LPHGFGSYDDPFERPVEITGGRDLAHILGELCRHVASECRDTDAKPLQIRRAARSTEIGPGLVLFATDQLAVNLFFGLTAGRTACELATFLAREESSVTEALQDDDDRDRFITLESPMRGVEGFSREHPVVWITLASIDDGDSRPRTGRVAP
jgi:hypothetical protein